MGIVHMVQDVNFLIRSILIFLIYFLSQTLNFTYNLNSFSYKKSIDSLNTLQDSDLDINDFLNNENKRYHILFNFYSRPRLRTFENVGQIIKEKNEKCLVDLFLSKNLIIVNENNIENFKKLKKKNFENSEMSSSSKDNESTRSRFLSA